MGSTKMARFLAVMLVLGGVVGIAITVWLSTAIVGQAQLLLLVMVPLGAVFAWAGFTGVSLWRDTAYGRRWAPILFASQIPLIVTSGPTVTWFTGLQIAPTLQFRERATELGLTFNLGASGQFYWGAEADGVTLGVNLFALFAFVILLRHRRAHSTTATSVSDAAASQAAG